MFWLNQFNSSTDLQKASKDANMLAYLKKKKFIWKYQAFLSSIAF